MPATLLLESFSVKHTGRRPWAASGLVGREVAHPAVGTLLVVDGDPVGDDDAGLGERVELLAVEALIPEAGVVALDDPVLPGAAWFDGDGLDAVGGHELLDGLGDELGAVVGPDVLGPGLLADHGLEEDADDVLLPDGGGHEAGDDALGELVDDEEDAQGASLPRAQHHEVPCPDLVGSGGLAQVRARRAAAAADTGLRGLALEAVFTAYPTHLAQADMQAEGPDMAEDLAVALGRIAVGQLDDGRTDLALRRVQARTVAEGVAVRLQRPADEALGGRWQLADDPAFRPGRRLYQRLDRRGRELRGDLPGDLSDLPRA